MSQTRGLHAAGRGIGSKRVGPAPHPHQCCTNCDGQRYTGDGRMQCSSSQAFKSIQNQSMGSEHGGRLQQKVEIICSCLEPDGQEKHSNAGLHLELQPGPTARKSARRASIMSTYTYKYNTSKQVAPQGLTRRDTDLRARSPALQWPPPSSIKQTPLCRRYIVWLPR